MSDQNEEQLAISVIAKIADLEKNMKRAEAITAKTYDAMQRNSTKATRQMETDMVRSTTRINQAVATTSGKIGAMGRAFSVGLTAGAVAAGVAVLALSAIVNKTKAALDDFGKIADQSAQAGLDPETFQEFGYQASLAGVDINEASGALNTFNKNAGLAVVGKGKMVQALKKLNPELLENIRNATSQADRVKLAADAIDKAKSASEKAALATTLFGDAGAKLVTVFKGGSAAMADIAASARELGIIIDNDLIDKADDLGDQFDTASQVMDRQFKKTMIDLAPVLISTAELAGDIAQAINLVIDSMRSFDNQSTKMLQLSQAANDMKRLENDNRILELSGQEKDGSISMMDRAELADLRAKNAVLTEQSAIMTDIQAKRNEAAKATAAAGGKDSGTDTLLPPITTPGSSSNRNKAAEDAIRQAAAVKDLIENLRIENEQIGMSAVDIAKANALRQAGAAATVEQRARIIELVEANAREKASNEALKQSMEDLKSTTSSFVTTFRQGMMNGEGAAASFKNAVSNMADTIMQKLESMAVDKLITGLFSALLGGLSGGMGGGVGGLLASPAKAAAPGALAKSAVRPASASQGMSAPGASHVVVSVDDDGKVRAYVEKQAGKTLAVGSMLAQKGLEDYRRDGYHKDFEKHAANRRRTGI